MMKDYIERQAAVSRFEQLKEQAGTLRDKLYLDGVLAVIDTIPEANAREDVHARWEPEENIFDDSTWYCSACHEPLTLIAGTPEENGMHFCPNCGAQMDGGDSND